jgi:hypothetical protein
VWTQASIQRCAQWLLALSALWVPLLGVALVCAVALAGSRWRVSAPTVRDEVASPEELAYDAFISYRRGTDAEFARDLSKSWKRRGTGSPSTSAISARNRAS